MRKIKKPCLIFFPASSCCCCCLLSDSEDECSQVSGFLKKMVDAVCHLNNLCKKKPSDDLKDLLADSGWHKETLPLEMMAMLEQVDYDYSDPEMRKLLCRLKTGTSTTKDLLESSFARLQSIAQRQNKNKKMNIYTKSTYAVANPHSSNSVLKCFQTPKTGLKLQTLCSC